MATRITKIKDIWASHPIFDQLVPIVITLAWLLFVAENLEIEDGARWNIFLTIATVSGMALAATTFVCSMTYQSANILMSKVVEVYSKDLRRNWVSIITSCLLTAVAPLVSLAIDKALPMAAMTIAVYAIALLLVRFARAIWWLQFTLFMQDKTSDLHGVMAVGLRADIADPVVRHPAQS